MNESRESALENELFDAVEEAHRLTEENARLRAAIQSRHDYGPASPGEQEAAWVAYCARSGWNPNEHPAAKNAYVEGFCDGDSYSEGDEGRAVLRSENDALRDSDERKTKQILELKDSHLSAATRLSRAIAAINRGQHHPKCASFHGYPKNLPCNCWISNILAELKK